MDLKKKQKVLRLIPNGMFIFTSRVGEKYGAATITWVTQVAFKPPLIAAAIRPDSTTSMKKARSGFMRQLSKIRHPGRAGSAPA